MIKYLLPLPISFLVMVVTCSQSAIAENLQPSASIAASPPKTSANHLTQLFSRVWRVTKAPSKPALGSIYVFLPNGTLLQTSCVETYRISTWTIDKAAPRVLRVVEDGQLTYTATIAQLTDTTLQLQQILVPNKQKQTITLTAVQQEFVCPDLPR
ncbi:hypothetical protein ACKFKG_33055 [Phormidesmis sp. 146-35]